MCFIAVIVINLLITIFDLGQFIADWPKRPDIERHRHHA